MGQCGYVLRTVGTVVDTLLQRVAKSAWHHATGCHCELQGCEAIQCGHRPCLCRSSSLRHEMSKVWGMSKYTLLVMVIAEMDSGGLVVWLSLLSNLQAYFYMKGVLAFLTKKCEQNKEQTIKDMSCYDCM